jgi:hypothetical protein
LLSRVGLGRFGQSGVDLDWSRALTARLGPDSRRRLDYFLEFRHLLVQDLRGRRVRIFGCARILTFSADKEWVARGCELAVPRAINNLAFNSGTSENRAAVLVHGDDDHSSFVYLRQSLIRETECRRGN